MDGKTKLLKIYVGEQEHYQDKPLYQYLVRLLKEKGIGGVTVSRGIEGYGQDKVLHTARLLELSADLPIVLEAIDEADKIDALLPDITKIVPRGLVFTVDLQVHKYGANS